MVIEVNDDNFEKEVVKSSKPVAVDFWAEWCGPCKVLSPRFEELSTELDKVKFVKLDVEANQETAGKYQVMSIPTIIFFKNGKAVGRSIGAMPKEELKEKIEAALT